MVNTVPRIGVIIPFYQEKRGILSQAIKSILEQTISEPLFVIVVDDGSPVTASEELDCLHLPPRLSIKIIRQNNRGPGSARNTGLAHTETLEIVAFLDSDDQWTTEHLARGVLAIDSGFDMYCSNWIMISGSENAFSVRNLSDNDLRPFRHMSDAYELTLPFMEQQIKGSVAKMSTLVLSRQFIGRTRFNEDIRMASEDRLFCFELGARRPRVAISKRPEVTSGRGVNIYEGVEPYSAKSLRQKRDKVIALKEARKLALPFPEAHHGIIHKLRDLRKKIAFNFWSVVRRRQVRLRDVYDIIRIDPICIWHIFFFPLKWGLGWCGKKSLTKE